MDEADSEAALRILCAVALADGTLDETEERAIAALLGASASIVRDSIDVVGEARRIQSADARNATFDAAVALSSVDGKCTVEEHALLERLSTALRVKPSFDLAVAEDSWRARLEEPRAEFAAAEIDFLHALSSAKGGGVLAPERYVALVAELRQRRTRVLEEALGGVLHA